jgi:diadenosine tetraphosphatase ApaH/serine/threonine PP2A family protein phosphatase
MPRCCIRQRLLRGRAVHRDLAGLVADPRTAVPVADILPWDPEPRPLRVALLDYLAIFAQACRLKIADEDLVRDAYPAGRDEADLSAHLAYGAGTGAAFSLLVKIL